MAKCHEHQTQLTAGKNVDINAGKNIELQANDVNAGQSIYVGFERKTLKALF